MKIERKEGPFNPVIIEAETQDELTAINTVLEFWLDKHDTEDDRFDIIHDLFFRLPT